MKQLTDKELDKGWYISICKCCGSEYKTHGMMNSTTYSSAPGFGCYLCEGKAEKRIKAEKSLEKLVGNKENDTLDKELTEKPLPIDMRIEYLKKEADRWESEYMEEVKKTQRYRLALLKILEG